jgi:hypothetical protein
VIDSARPRCIVILVGAGQGLEEAITRYVAAVRDPEMLAPPADPTRPETWYPGDPMRPSLIMVETQVPRPDLGAHTARLVARAINKAVDTLVVVAPVLSPEVAAVIAGRVQDLVRVVRPDDRTLPHVTLGNPSALALLDELAGSLHIARDALERLLAQLTRADGRVREARELLQRILTRAGGGTVAQ